MNEPIPEFADLAADPEIAPLLGFEPVVRKVKRPDGWTPDLQRELIARLAVTGTLQAAVWQMGKHATGAETLYKTPGVDSFRAAWDAAIAIGRGRAGLEGGPPFAGAVPGITRRQPPGRRPSAEPEDEFAMTEDGKLELAERLATKFLRKVEAEREARLAGEIVAADVYLRQITVLEVMFDLMTTELGATGPWEMLTAIRRGGHGFFHIVDTPFATYLDAVRREYWESTPGEPMRPIAFREEYLRDCGDHRASLDLHAYGALTPPARGFTQEQWYEMDYDAQKAARVRQQQEDAQTQILWEATARAEFEARQNPSPSMGEGRVRVTDED